MSETKKPELNPDGISVKGCSIIYAPAGQAGEYSALAANPYRGCGHKCAYCLSGDTLVQMADGSTLPIRDVRIGDQIVGVIDTGNKHWPYKYTKAEVTAKLRSVKPAVRISFENGRSVTCSGDHRWLTDRGWKYAEGAMSGPDQRPYLTINNRVRALGPALPALLFTDDYKRGYLSGIIRGDGHLSRYDYSGKYQRSGRSSPQTTDVQHHFRLALNDTPALHRAADYLLEFGIATTSFEFKHGDKESMPAIRASSAAAFTAITALIESPNTTSGEWLRGWLAGIFDAEGGNSAECRISNTDEEILAMIERAETYFGFDHERDSPNEAGCVAIRFRGGLSEATRFFQLVRPALTRKWDIFGRSTCDSFQVESVTPLGVDLEMFDITTTAETFIANGLVSHNCYVPNVLRMDRVEFDEGAIPRPDYLRLLTNDAVKYRRAGITEQVMLSFTTDVYNPTDTSLTRPSLEILADHGLGFCTLTKGGSRALCDLGLFRPGRDAFASTLTSLEDGFSLKWERGAALPQDRIDTLRTFHENGIYTWVSLEPVLDTAATLEIIRQTHPFVDLFKVGRVNYVGLTKTTDWERFTGEVLEVLAQTGARHYIKRDLQPFLPADYANPVRVPQYREPFPIVG